MDNMNSTTTNSENTDRIINLSTMSTNSTTRTAHPPVLNFDSFKYTDTDYNYSEYLSPEQLYAFNKFKQGKNLFITGNAGTGKSTLIKYLLNDASMSNKKIKICALTGCASLLLNCKATTIHSWSGIKICRGLKQDVINRVASNMFSKKNWKETDILIIDEVSMMSKKIFEVLNAIGKRIRYNNRPFGGIQVIFCGDFFQLPPVESINEPETGMFCFESEEWYEVFKPENHIELTTIFRQQEDPTYKNILNQIRRGTIDEEGTNILYSLVEKKIERESNITKILPTRSQVERINKYHYNKLSETEYEYQYSPEYNNTIYFETTTAIEKSIIQMCNNIPADEKENEIKALLLNSRCEINVNLKKGAFVMCTINLDLENGICNGSQGIIEDYLDTKDGEMPRVRFTNGILKMIPYYTWQSERIPTLSISQIPLCLAWAITIHKIQGSTLDRAEIDIGNKVFEFGQTYVALSRVRSLEGLYLTSFDPLRIKANPTVITFYNSFNTVAAGAGSSTSST